MRTRLARTLPILALVPLVLFLLPDPASPVAGPSARSIPQSLQMALPRRAPATDLTQAVRRGIVSPQVARAAGAGPVEAIVILDGNEILAAATAEAPAAIGRTQAVLGVTRSAYAAMKDRVLGRLGGVTVLQDFDALPLLFVRFSGPAAVLNAANDAEVTAIAPNRTFQRTLSQSLPLIGQPTAAANGNDGGGVGVAILDSGLDFTRAAFGSCSSPGVPAGCKVVLALDTAPDDGVRDDNILHGTNVGGIVAGVAPGASLLAYDVFDGNSASTSDIVEAINSAIANQATFNVRAMNLSLGVPQNYNTVACSGGNPFAPAFANARAVRITPVVAAGNDAFAQGGFTNGISIPSCTPGAVSVGAVYDGNNGGLNWGDCQDGTTAADQITCFSQSASILTVLGPGALIEAAGVLQGGTSQATPHVAGAVAVLAEAAPGASVDAITTAIANSGPSILDARNGVSKHRFDLPAAVAAIGTTPSPSTSPTASPSPSPSTSPSPGNCTVLGTNVGEVLVGTPGNDVICGNNGDDYIIPGGGDDTVVGGNGFDFVSYEDATGPVTVNLGTQNATGFGNDQINGVEGVVGGPFADQITGDGGPNDILGLAGNDVLFGAEGFDFVRFDFAGGVVANLGPGSATGEGTDAISGFEGIVGSLGADRLTGRQGANVLFGLTGPDELAGLGRDDDLFGMGGGDLLLGGRGNDDLNGGAGRDTCDQGSGSGAEVSC